jgi:sRNA-binding protein
MVKDFWKEPKARAYELHKMMTSREGMFLKPLEAAKKNISGEISRYLTDQERIRREEQRKADEAARAALEAQKASVEDAESSPIPFIVPTVVSGIDKTMKTDTGSLTQRTEIEITVTDIKKLLAAIIASEVPESILEISIPKLKQFVKLTQAKEIPGCTIEEVVKASFRAS